MTAGATHLAHAADLLRTIPRFTADVNRLALELYRQLALGKPVAHEDLADSLGVSVDAVKALLAAEQLKAWALYDDQNRIIGFRGLAVEPMPHRFQVRSQVLFTWCAVDSLFIPELLGLSARVESEDPHTGRTIRVTVTPEGVESADPAGTVMSYVAGDPEVRRTNPAKVMAAFCHHIFFLESPEAGAEWAAEHGHGAFIVSLDEAFELGRLFNAAQFG